MSGKNDAGFGQTTVSQSLRKRAEETLSAGDRPLKDMSAAEMSTLIHELHIHRVELEIQNEELRKSLARTERSRRAYQDLLVVIDKDFRVVMSNWKDHEYVSEKDRQGHPFCYEVFMSRNGPCDPCHAMEVFRTGEAKQLEAINPIDGKIRDIRVLPMFDDKGEVAAVIEHIRDITERNQALEKLRKSEARYRALSEATFEAIFISENGICLYTNQRAVELFGYDYEELIGIFGTDIIAAESKELVKRNMLSGYEKPYAAIAQKKDGTKFHVEICGKMMKYEEKNVRMTVVRDINEQKLAEEALRESEKRYRNLFNGIPIGLYRTTAEGAILDVNPAMLEILGYSDQDALLQTASPDIYVDPEDRKQLQCLMEEKGFVHDFTVQMRRPDGRRVWVSINATIVHDSNGQTTYYEGAMADISDRKESEKRIHELSHQLMQAQEDERQMISRELHDRVAQDLSTLLIGLNTLSDHQPNVIPEIRTKTFELSQILRGTIEAVRDLSYDLRLPGLEGMGLIPALCMYCEECEEKWGLKIDFQSIGMDALNLDFDTKMNLYRLIQEGLNNIRKHAAANQASVKLVGAHPNIILRIEDDGRGFDVEKRARTADSEKRMGLRSMAERVRLIQGEMQIQSQPEQGTRIFVKFPYQEKKHGSK